MRTSIVLSALAIVLLVGCGKQPQKDHLLVTAYVQVQETQGEQILATTKLSQVSFITLSGKTISASLPLGEEYGCCMSFELQATDSIITALDVFISFGGRMRRDIFPEQAPASFDGPHQGGQGHRVAGHAGTPIKLAKWSYGRNRRTLNYTAIIVAEKLDSEPIRRPDEGYEYKGKLYHFLQNVDPRIMRHGKADG